MTSADALHPGSPKGGYINAPQVTDSLAPWTLQVENWLLEMTPSLKHQNYEEM